VIRSYQDYLTYLEADRIALRQDKTLKSLLFDDIWKFQRLLRKLEYQINCQPGNPLRFLTSFRYRRLGTQLGFSIPINVFGPGLSIAHRGTIVVHHNAKIGANCRLHVCVNIGAQAGKPNEVPQIGDNCYIGPGAKIFGAVILGNNMAIGANAVVNKSFPEGNCTIGGIPAKKISDKTSEGLLIKGFPLEKVEV
jgi:serine O-acetyltransferase